MNDEKTLEACARNGCDWCAYVLGYLDYHNPRLAYFPSQVVTAIAIANQFYTCKQASIVEYNAARRMFHATRARGMRPVRTTNDRR